MKMRVLGVSLLELKGLLVIGYSGNYMEKSRFPILAGMSEQNHIIFGVIHLA